MCIRDRCNVCKLTCPVHVLGAALLELQQGAQPFAGISSNEARAVLRRKLAQLGVPNSAAYGTHDLKRGHSEDMVRSGKTMLEILIAAGWHAPGSHRSYADMVALEMDACLEAHVASIAEDDE